MRFIQMWFIPSVPDLAPSVEQKAVERAARENRFLPLVSESDPGALPIRSEASVHSCFLRKGGDAEHRFAEEHGGYLYVLEGGGITANKQVVPTLGAAMITGTPLIAVRALEDTELLLVEVGLTSGR